jgi:hypothetical protein
MHTGNIDHDVLLLFNRNQVKLGTTNFGWIWCDVLVKELNYYVAYFSVKTVATVGLIGFFLGWQG